MAQASRLCGTGWKAGATGKLVGGAHPTFKVGECGGPPHRKQKTENRKPKTENKTSHDLRER